jgi:hypothetical protein
MIGCTESIKWFATQVIKAKIAAKLKFFEGVQQTEEMETARKNVVRDVILQQYDRNLESFKNICLLEPKPESQQQIDKDLGRTFPRHEFFMDRQRGYQQLRNVLRAFACYDTQVDYVQGMNFIVG